MCDKCVRPAIIAATVANWLTFVLWTALLVSALLAIVEGQARVPLASEAEQALAPLFVSRDGSTVTFRSTAIDALTIRVEPAAGKFGKVVTFTVGDVRAGRWGQK